MSFEDTVIFCKSWFAENKIEIPRTAKEWSAGRSGKTVPPGCTYQTLRKKGIKVGSLLETINPSYTNRINNDQNSLSFIEDLGLTFISKEGKESINYKCNSCNKTDTTLKGTLRRWHSKGLKYCSICRKASGKVKSVEYYQNFLDESEFKVLSVVSRTITIEHTKCKNTFTRSSGYIVGAQRSSSSLVSCPHCSTYFIHGATSSYTSLVEKECIEYLVEILPSIVEREVLYKDIMTTNRDFRLDVWLPKYRIGIEITSANNNLHKYKERLSEKLALASSEGIDIRIATSKSDIEDIVRSLPKGKES